MLDEKYKAVLVYIVKECNSGYKIFDIDDLLNCIPEKYKPSKELVTEIMKYFDEKNFISIKYFDNEVYCLSVLKNAKQTLENEILTSEKNKRYKKLGIVFYISLSLTCFVASFLGTIIALVLFRLI